MHGGELGQQLAAATGQAQLDLAPVGARHLAQHELLVHQPVDQPDRAVVLDEELTGEIADRHAPLVGTRAQHQHRLVVLRGEADGRGRVLAEPQEAAQRVAERGELRVVARRQPESGFGLPQQHDGLAGGAPLSRPRGRPSPDNIVMRHTRAISFHDILASVGGSTKPGGERHAGTQGGSPQHQTA